MQFLNNFFVQDTAHYFSANLVKKRLNFYTESYFSNGMSPGSFLPLKKSKAAPPAAET